MTGATGHLGSRLLERLLSDARVERVRSVARRPVASHPKLVHTRADLRSSDARRALAGVDVLWHLGFQLWRQRRGLGRTSEPDDANVAGTANVVAARPSRIVFASSAAVYGAWPDNPLPLDETVVPRPNPECPYASDKLEAERICAEAAPSASLRICAVLGPNADPAVRRASAGYRRAVPVASGIRQAVQFLHEDDAADALIRAGMSAVTGPYNVATEDWLEPEQIADVAGGRVLRAPLRVLVTGAEVAYRARLLGFGADRAILLGGPLALDPSRAEDAWTWRASQPSRKVLADFLAPHCSRP
ncbi:MAG TPA: NAD-dependent epimerase/dehydratase family protein [Acidimicrobiales bacterium]|nr:NAD-dependent epimerase/dehydratase family protein [Acidimicrobiales bacterium]